MTALVHWIVKHKTDFEAAIGPESGIASPNDLE